MPLIDRISEDVQYSTRGTFADAVVGKLLIMYSDARSYPDDEWAEHCRFIIGMQKPAGRISAGLVYAPFAGPSAKQRNLLRDWHNDNQLGEFSKLALCTSSAVARAATAAFTWWLKLVRGTEMRSFRTEDLAAACSWLEQFTPVGHKAVDDLIATLRQGCAERRR